MFGIGSTELLVILVVALVVLGPKSLSGVARSLGKAMGEFRRVSTDFQRALNVETAREEAREAENKKNASPSVKSAPEPAAAESAPASAVEVPEDSPLARALEKTRSQAETATQQKPEEKTRDGSQHA